MELEIPDSVRTGERPPKHEKNIEPKRVEIVLRVEAAEVKTEDTAKEEGRGQIANDPIPARMLNEFVYCKRLFYYEFVEGVFVESADTLRGGAIHERVDSGSGAMPETGKSKVQGPPPSLRFGAVAPKPKAKAEKSKVEKSTSPESLLGTAGDESTPHPGPLLGRGGEGEERHPGEPETIHSRSVQMGSERLGVVAKMDLVESKLSVSASLRRDRAEAKGEGGQSPKSSVSSEFRVPSSELNADGVAASHPGGSQSALPGTQVEFTEDLFTQMEVCPVDYKAGAPRKGEDANELWDTDKMQLGLQALILRENGYTCNEGIVYYRATKQRVRLPITPELESWILQNIAEARRVLTGPIPAPLVNSPKCVRCSLAPVCLPDETRMLAKTRESVEALKRERVGREDGEGETPSEAAGGTPAPQAPRRLMAQRDDTRALYLNTQGFRVGCKEEVLQVKDKEKVVDEVRLRDLSHVALFGNIQVSTQAIQSLCEQEIPVTYFSMGGWFYGITRGHGLKNVFLRMEQFRLARDEATCLSLARQFVHGKIRNHRTLLMRNHLEPPEPTILKLKRASEDALAAGTIEELLGIEGAAASQYFQQFSGMVKIADDLASPGEQLPNNHAKQLAFNFNFASRNRRPPTDPVNAMLSLAYSLLSKDCTLAVLAVGFDPYIGFYHQPRFGRPALGLDVMEEFRALIAESTVLSCINNRVVTEKDFVRAGQAVNLTAPGRKRFFQMYEQRMGSLITHPLFDYKVSYRRALELQARLLAKALTGEIAEYIPLTTR